MKYGIELYQKEVAISDNPATLGLMWRVCALISLVWVSVFIYQSIVYYENAIEVAQISDLVESSEAELDKLRHTLSKLQLTEKNDRMDHLKEDIKIRQKLLAVLGEGNLVSYASIVKDLAYLPWKSVALHELEITEGGISLHGEATEASAVPVWIKGFGNIDNLRDRTFGQLSIDAQPDGSLKFTLKTESE